MKMSKYLRELPNRQTIKTSELMKHYFQMVSLDKEMQIGMSETANTDLLISAFKTTQMYLAKVGIIGKIRGSLSNVNQSYWDDFLSGAVVNVSLKWLNDGMKESPEYMGKLIASFVSHQDAIG
ncbi:TetR-like C-terminal domain-containing protein [Lentilactobacillus kosonis]|nr:TetR-like C-terminal domain-containing protein [Lentilactobacillus kosonis]